MVGVIPPFSPPKSLPTPELAEHQLQFAAANQAVTLTRATNERAVTRRVTGSTYCRSVQLVCLL